MKEPILRNEKQKLILFLMFLHFFYCSTSFGEATQGKLKVTKQSTKAGHQYLILQSVNAKAGFVVKRPSQSDSTILLSIPAAFTQTKNNKIDGLYLLNGVIGNSGNINHSIGGGLQIVNGEVKIFPTNKGNLLTKTWINSLAKQNGSFFQQIQCVQNGKAASFQDNTKFQRRGIVQFKNKQLAIVESNSELTLKQFTDDMVELGALNVLYTDMGAWDAGWYRDSQSGEIITIGQDLSQTAKQSNWFVLKSK
jgi:hypothetical protein